MESDTKPGASSGDTSKPSTVHQIVHGIYRREGEFWTVTYGGHVIHIRETKGLGYIAHLLRHPNVEFHALDLFAGIGAASLSTDEERRRASSLDLGEEEMERAGLRRGIPEDAGDMLDDEAKVSYRRRLVELRELLDDAREIGNNQRAAELEDEIDALTRELARAVGLGGRDRRAGSVSERARLNATRAIRTAIAKITENNAVIGELLRCTIKTGTFCSYNPTPASPIQWEFGAPSISVGLAVPLKGVGAVEKEERGNTGIADRGTVLFRSLPLEGTAFVGRVQERGYVSAAIDHAFHGNGSVTLLAGGAGVGKTRLALECARDAALKGALVLIGHCYESKEPYPYLPFVEMLEAALEQAQSRETYRNALGENAPELAQLMPRLRRMYPDISPPLELPAEQARRYLFESLSDFLARSATTTRPVFLMIDDLHWADEATLLLLVHVSHRIAAMPVAVIATYRDGAPNLGANLVKSLEDLLRTGFRPLRLRGLDRNGVAAMLSAMSAREPPPNLIDAIFEETQGNPFFVEELYKHLVEEGAAFDSEGNFLPDLKISELDVPENVRLVVRRRADRLPEEVRAVLTAAAVIGRSFSFKLLQSFESFNEDTLLKAIDEGLRAGLILSSTLGPEAPFSFSHELVRQSLLTEISGPRRQRLHALVARAIEKTYSANLEDHAAELANHLTQATASADGSRLVHYLGVAGKRALEAAAYEDALRYLTDAVSRHDISDRAKHAELLADLATTERSLGKWEDALGHWRKALELYTALGNRLAGGNVYIAIVEALSWAGRYFEGAEFTFRGLALSENDITTDRARLLGAAAVIQTSAGAYQPAEDALLEAVRLAEQLNDPRTLGLVLSYRSFHNFVFLRPDKAVADGIASAEILHGSGSLWSLAQHLSFVASADYALGRLAEATNIVEELDPLARKLGHFLAQMRCNRIRAWIEFSQGCDLTRLEEWFRRDLEFVGTANLPWINSSYAQLALVRFLRGDWEAALQSSERSCAAEFPTAFDGWGAGMLLRQRAYANDLAGALSLFAQKKDRLPHLDQPSPIGGWGLLMLTIEGLFILGEREQAAELYPLARQAAKSGVICLEVISRFTQTVAGLAAAAGKQWDKSEEHFQIAMRQAGEFPHRLEQMEIRRFYAQMLIERNGKGDRYKARAMLGEAIEGYSLIGMPRHVIIAQELLKT
jgi:eukaryotic-like serine/threonine-protein kinase